MTHLRVVVLMVMMMMIMIIDDDRNNEIKFYLQTKITVTYSVFVIKELDIYKIRKLITVYKNPTAGSYSESDESNPLSPTGVGRGEISEIRYEEGRNEEVERGICTY
jgi:hypothetical protein